MQRAILSQGAHDSDAVVDLARTLIRWPDRADDFVIKLLAIADEIWQAFHEDRIA
ncbi:hypothetical protein [Bradyrhizobium sp. SEMIA]|uniref:hypothetical protein n=1 Tax=Bradyrhizobium sp. SEMIA TaxID=2597515 RepID=UPI0018A375B5|nr:hypothetical protein [Bradyrhizobium sp. SEMIA]QOG23343.1 hypothetical protein FOM02_44970 [Bradyrhizobium sp. SEMIA]